MRRTPTFLAPFACGIAVAIAATTLVGQAESSAEAAGKPANAAQRYEDLSLFTSILELIRNHYVEPVDEHALLQSAMRGLLEDLDPHSSFMEPSEFDEMQVETKGEFHGLGIEISKATGEYIEVVSPIEGTPAQRAGIKARDRITSICPTEKPEEWTEPCRGTAEMSLVEAVALMRGRKGTTISIYVLREGMTEPRRFDIQRDTVTVASVRSKLVEPGIGHLRVSSFQERTGQDVGQQLERLEQENAGGLKGLVVDLRDNPGGLLNQAVEMADHWLGEGLVVYTQGRSASERTEYRSDAAVTGGDYPIVVLVNEGSASASEIVAGALQDRHRAIVLGQSTFGKGSVQTVYPLEGGAGLRLTTALYYTPAGRSIQEVGIQPDIEVDPGESPELGLPNRRRMRESDLDGHFTQGDAKGRKADAPVPIRRPPPRWPGAEGASPEDAPADGQKGGDDRKGGAGKDGAAGEADGNGAEAEERPAIDVQLARAVEVLKTWQYFDDLRAQRVKPAETAAAEPASSPEPASAPATEPATEPATKPATTPVPTKPAPAPKPAAN